MTIKTYAFPHAGGSAYNLHRITRALRTLSLHAMDYPGHGRRIREPLATTVEAMALDALEAIRAELSAPYVLFGHSMGARVALLTARHVALAGLPLPKALIVSGTPAPGHGSRDRIAELPDDEFLRELQDLGGLPQAILDDEAMMEMFLPILRADLRAVEAAEIEPFTVPIPLLALHGREDDHDRAGAAAWRERTTSVFLLEELEGGHFFLYDDPEATAKAIDRQMTRLLTAR